MGNGVGRSRVMVKERCLRLHWQRQVILSDVVRMWPEQCEDWSAESDGPWK